MDSEDDCAILLYVELLSVVEDNFKIFRRRNATFVEASNTSKKLIIIGFYEFFSESVLHEVFRS